MAKKREKRNGERNEGRGGCNISDPKAKIATISNNPETTPRHSLLPYLVALFRGADVLPSLLTLALSGLRVSRNDWQLRRRQLADVVMRLRKAVGRRPLARFRIHGDTNSFHEWVYVGLT